MPAPQSGSPTHWPNWDGTSINGHPKTEFVREVIQAAADPNTIAAWKANRIGGLLKQYAEHIRRTKPKTEVWLHTQCPPAWGHDPATMQANGIACLAPHTIQFPETRQCRD